MKVKLIKDKEDHVIGWSMEGEDPEEVGKINAIRNIQFFGFDDTRIVYDGRSGGDENSAGKLKWKQFKHTTNGKKEKK
jgi:hypothetical protein